MSEALLKKMGDVFIPVPSANNPDDLQGIRSGDVIKVKFSRPRNPLFHRKYFAMLNVGFEAFEPDAEHKGIQVQKNFERFRKDVIIASGFYEPVANINGDVRAEAKSISFGNMAEEEFNTLYNASCNVLLQKVLKNYTRADLDEIVETLVRF